MPETGLTKIRFKHFKAFDELVEMDIAPITVIAGVNSGGKSTIIQSLLLARQTLITPYRQSVENALEYDGDLVRFGSFREMIFGKPTNYKGGMWLGFTVRGKVPPNRVSVAYRTEFFKNIPTSFNGLIDLDLDVRFNNISAKKIVVPDQAILRVRSISNPSIYFRLMIEAENDAWKTTIQIEGREQSVVTDSVSFDRFIPVWRPYSFVGDENSLIQQMDFTNLYRRMFEPALKLLRSELEERLFYVGPLRSAPQRTYTHRSSTGLDIGTAGESAIQQLYDHGDEEVTFVKLPSDLRFIQPEQLEVQPVKLLDAVRDSLQLLGMGQLLKIAKHGESYEASLNLLSRPKTYAFITEVGFGVSQILPIITLGLLSPTDSILIFEQPEIHLHPRAQAGLAEFLLCLARTGRRILVETHSDHLINRLRRRAAEDETDTFGAMVNILFVTPPTTDGEGAKIERARINKYGDIENWPPSFLADAAQDARAIMLAGSNKRIREQRQEQVG